MIFIDTNYFLRFILKDNSQQSLTAKNFFINAIKKNIQLTTSLVVVLEIYWVLSSVYKKDSATISQIIDKILALQCVKFENKKILDKAIALYRQSNLGLEDCLHLSYAQHAQVSDFKTFDKKLYKTYLKTRLRP